MLAELVHSVADFANQVAFAFNPKYLYSVGHFAVACHKNPLVEPNT